MTSPQPWPGRAAVELLAASRAACGARHELLADYLPWAEVIAVPDRPPRVPPCRDANDLPYLHLAVAGGADVLVTGDADLLSVAAPARSMASLRSATQPRRRFRVLTVQAFLKRLLA